MFRKVLVANRGEIAVRVIRACKELGLKTVAVYSQADEDSLHVHLADESVCIGPPLSVDSYLKPAQIISAAEITDADAIHPGYGFLAENAQFAQMCEKSGVTFIGPSPENIRMMGDKSLAKENMQKAGVPTVPGNKGILKDVDHAIEAAYQIGYPVILKASAGGGGKGMRIVGDVDGVQKTFKVLQGEAQAAFGSPDLYIEKYIQRPRHIEVQLIGDTHGNVIHLGERDCSIQRRHQKLVEEAPSPAVSDELRDYIGGVSVQGAKGIGYRSAGTIEYLMDDQHNFYFMEMNTRIQVEHPVTEWITGVDLVKEQIRVAMGEKLSVTQADIHLHGHAIECRINAEDPSRNFAPSPGQITAFHAPGGIGVRVDSHCYTGYHIPPFYDSMIAKVITHGHTRQEAIARMRRALEEFVIEGVNTTIPFHLKVLEDPTFLEGTIDTTFIERIHFK
ncbi:MAG: acetyl-CoA carboxylase biotin carboxylase subunit [Gemmatimonadetes bacterium]|nr:MAG: acetyl-CoA carboxylase biotin carboxylase subunit [Gemmatimonadota bacterium]